MKVLSITVMLVFAISTSVIGQLHNHIIAYYPLDGDGTDLSGHCLNGTVYGATAAKGVDGTHLTAMQFDGVDDYIEIDPHPSFNFSEKENFSISFWFKVDSKQADLDTTDNDLLSKWVINDNDESHLRYGYPFTFRIFNDKSHDKGNLIAAQFGGYNKGCGLGTTVRSKITSDKFYHVLLNVKGGIFFLYLDGQLAQRIKNRLSCSSQNEAPLRLGKRGGLEFQNHFKGTLDELVIIDRALTHSEIAYLYSAPTDLGFKIETARHQLVKTDTLYFDDNIFQLNARQRVDLAYVHRYLELGESFHLVIEGHSNGLPDDDFCDELSLKRAKVIEDYLLALGISCTKITTKGLGKRHQISPNTTKELRKKNQRAEIKLYKTVRA